MFRIKQTCVPVSRKAKDSIIFRHRKRQQVAGRALLRSIRRKDSQTQLKRGQRNVITLFSQETCDVTGCTKLCS